MGRLTERCGNTYVPNENANYEPMNCMDKLGRLEDLEEQGRLTELPCAVGDAVWEIDEYATGFKARPMTVLSIKLKENKGFVYTAYSDEHDNFVRGYGFDDFGEILFLTKEEAERKLKELEGDKE